MIKKIFQSIREKLSVLSIDQKNENTLRTLFVSILASIGFLTLFFLPIFGLSGLVIRDLITPILAGIIVIIISVQSLKQGTFTLVDKKSSFVLLVFLGLLLISSLFAISPRNAIFGGFDGAPSFLLMVSLIVFLYAASLSFKKFSRVFGILMVTSFIYVLIFLHHIIRIIFGPQVLSFGFLNTTTSSLFGSWIDFSVISLLVVIFAVICLEIGKFVRVAKWIALSIGILGLIGLFLTNVSWVWILAGGILIITSIYLFSFAYWDPEKLSYDKGRIVPWYSIGAFIIVLIGLLFGNFIVSFVSQIRPIAYTDLTPTVTATLYATKAAISENALFGTGLGSYDVLWNKVKPVSFSGTVVGNSTFHFGDSFVGTQIATTGIAGIIAFISFFVFLGYQYFLLFKNGFWNTVDRFSTTLIFAGSLFLTVTACIYYPSVGTLLLWMVFVGALWGTVHRKETRISFIHDPRASFFGILIVLVLISVGGIMVYMNARKITSVFAYSFALKSFNAGDINTGDQSLLRANSLWYADFYNRAIANRILAQVNTLPAPQEGQSDALARQVQVLLGQALNFAESARALDKGNYENWLTLGNIYQVFSQLGVEGALDKTKESYNQVFALSPNDRTLDTVSANLLVLEGKMADAEQKINDSINTYPTVNAFLWLYQKNLSENKIAQAEQNLINAFQVSAATIPNAGIANQLGALYFSQAKYNQAIGAFLQSLIINRAQPLIFAYIGVSYERAGDTAQANQFYDVLRRELPDQAQSLIDTVKRQSTSSNNTPVLPDVLETETTDAVVSEE